MGPGAESKAAESAVRAIATAYKALRLYPPTSPIPRQSIDDAVIALESSLASRPVLPLVVGREGFDLDHAPLAPGAPGLSDLADTLRAHGVAELDLLPGCTADDLVKLLDLLGQEPAALHQSGGLAARLAAEGVEGVRVAEVALTVVNTDTPELGQDAEEFLRELAADSDKLAAWLAAAAAGDLAGLAEGLEELIAAAGSNGASVLAANLAEAFRSQDTDVRDALIGCAIEPGVVHDLSRSTFSHLGGSEIAEALCSGLYGENMLSLSNVLTKLPLQERIDEVRTRVQAALAEHGHSDKEAHFLEHMLEVRSSPQAEQPLSQTELYGAVARALSLEDADLEQVRESTAAETLASNAAAVRTMLVLLDQQNDFELYCRSADSVAAMVPRLVEGGDLALATNVVRALVDRAVRSDLPWPELPGRLQRATGAAFSTRTAEALIAAAASDSTALAEAQTLVRLAPESAGPPLLAAALARGEDAVPVARELLGRRFNDLVAEALPSLPWYQLRVAVSALAPTGDSRFTPLLQEAARRDDEQSRREVATALAAAGNRDTVPLLASMVRDSSAEVAIIAVRAMAKHRTAGSGDLLARRLGELDLDGEDFLLGREIIGALARIDEPAAADALRTLAARKALIKRGHFTEVQQLARQALDVKARKGGA